MFVRVCVCVPDPRTAIKFPNPIPCDTLLSGVALSQKEKSIGYIDDTLRVLLLFEVDYVDAPLWLALPLSFGCHLVPFCVAFGDVVFPHWAVQIVRQ